MAYACQELHIDGSRFCNDVIGGKNGARSGQRPSFALHMNSRFVWRTAAQLGYHWLAYLRSDSQPPSTQPTL